MMRRGSILAALVLTASLGLAQAPSDAGPWTLEAAIAAARARNPAARAAESDALTARLNVRKAFAQGYLPRLELSVFSGLVPEARGDIFTSPDEQTDLDGLGIFSRLNLDVTQPLMTFGRAGAAVTAAREAAGAEESRRDQFFEDLSLEVVKAFWGLVSALRAEDLARESGESYEELLAEIEKRLAREDSEVDDENLFEARSHQLEIEVVKEDSIERKAQAARLLCLLLDLDPATPVSVTGAPAPVFSADEDLMRKMTDRAEGSRPDILALASAERALGAKILLRNREGWPVLFLAANFGYARASNRQDQTNPFVVDNFNYRNLGLALGLSWKPDLFVDPVEVRQAESERRAVEDRLAALRSLSAFEVSRAFGDARKNGALLEAARRSLAAAKAWVRLSRENWDMGLGDAYRLLRAHQSYFELRGAEIERENVLNVSLAKLAHVVGDVGLYVDWVERGKVVFD